MGRARLIEEAEEQREVLRGGCEPTLERSIQLADVSFNFGDKPVLEQFSMGAGDELTVLSGASGGGKTTITDLILGLREPQSGTRPARRRATAGDRLASLAQHGRLRAAGAGSVP